MTGGEVTENEPGGIVALTAQTQQILVHALREIEFAAERMKVRLPVGNLKELWGRTQLFPQLPCAGIGLTRFRRGEALNDQQGSAQTAA